MTDNQTAPRARRLTALLATLTLALSACAGQSSDTLIEPESPLNAYLSAIPAAGYADFPVDGGPSEQQAFVEQKLRETENLTAQCMAKQGWDYTPDTVSTIVSVSQLGEDGPWEPDNREWVARYGYGLIHSPGQEAEAAKPPPTPPGPGPNEAYVSSLSQTEREAYDKALSGAGSEPGEDGSVDPYNWQDSGCTGWAEHEANGDDFWASSEFTSLTDAINRFWETSASEPGYAAIDAEWAACMDQAGHSGFRRQSEAQESIFTLMNDYTSNQPDDAGEDFGTAKDPGYAKIAETEVPLALADLDCREKTTYKQRHLQVQYALEQQFVDDHKVELDAALEEFGTGR